MRCGFDVIFQVLHINLILVIDLYEVLLIIGVRQISNSVFTLGFQVLLINLILCYEIYAKTELETYSVWYCKYQFDVSEQFGGRQ